MEEILRDLMDRAVEAQRGAHVPYSDTLVGAALLCADGQVLAGANVENASYGLTICAERVVMAKAVNEGRKQWTAIAIAMKGRENSPPCGACLQFMAEFDAGNLLIAWGENEKSFETARLKDLLPQPFRKNAGRCR